MKNCVTSFMDNPHMGKHCLLPELAREAWWSRRCPRLASSGRRRSRWRRRRRRPRSRSGSGFATRIRSGALLGSRWINIFSPFSLSIPRINYFTFNVQCSNIVDHFTNEVKYSYLVKRSSFLDQNLNQVLPSRSDGRRITSRLIRS